MSRNVKIAGVAALAGIMLAVVAVEALREPGHRPLDAVLPLLDEGDQQKLLARELEPCATLTMPDRDCETAWAENRRRFFGRDAAAAEPENTGDAMVADNTIETQTPGNVSTDPAGSIAP